jgi:hypothetical protein
MEWEKPQLVDLNMVKYAGQCLEGASVDMTGQCVAVGAGATGQCSVGSSAQNLSR